MASHPLFASASFEADDSDEGIVVAPNRDRAHTTEQEEREGDNAVVIINASQQTDHSSVLGEISIMKDFFVSAFSDGYYSVS